MAIFKCKLCGGSLEVDSTQSVAFCEYCGTKQTLPKLDDERKANLYDRAGHFRRNNDFDKAMAIYEQILEEDNTDAESYWSILLCRYGIEYVEDPTTHNRIPTINRSQFTSIFDDEDYRSALKYADDLQREVYEAEATTINEIQKGILAISQKEDPFDIFICYKETNENGSRTQDSVLATEMYHELTKEGFKVFFSRITLEDKLGEAYEPYIFAALNSAKVMIVVGTRPEYLNAVWVRNEWSRYLARIRNGAKKTIIPTYRDMDPYDLPEEFSHLQALDMSKLGFMQDLVHGVKKILKGEGLDPAAKAAAAASAATIEPIIKRAFLFLEDGDWASASEYCEKVLDIDPENAMAYLGKLMVELRLKRPDAFQELPSFSTDNSNYRKVMRFGDEALKASLIAQIEQIKVRNETISLKKRYAHAKNIMNNNTENSFKEASKLFEKLGDFEDSATLAKQCLVRAESTRKNKILERAKERMSADTIAQYEYAIMTFETIPGWKDADERLAECRERIEQLKAMAETKRIAAEQRAKRTKKILLITIPSVCAVVVAVIVFLLVKFFFIPNGHYNDAKALLDDGRYDEAVAAFEALNGFRNSETMVFECRYVEAMELMEDGKYSEAIAAFKALDGYSDSNEKITECSTAILDGKYNAAVKLMNDKKYTEAIAAFKALNGYRDSSSKITACNNAINDEKYNAAVKLMNAKKYTEAIAAFQALNGYKDSASKITACNNAIYDGKYQEAVKLVNARKYDEAIVILADLGTYKDSKTLLKNCYSAKLKGATIGSVVSFGLYEQDNNKSNGKEEIDWIVLAKEGTRLLVVSKKALDFQPFNKTEKDVTWETCSLRTWLNSDFKDAAFTAYEKTMIPTVSVTADHNTVYPTHPGNATRDQIFLMSAIEIDQYHYVSAIESCEATEYTKALGADVNNFYESCSWWLRTPGTTRSYAATVRIDGFVGTHGNVVSTSNAVRPAMWINIG